LFRWLFHRPLTRGQAIAKATDFLAANGYCVVPTAVDADFTGDAIAVMFRSATIPGRRWYIRFERVFPAGVSCTHADVTVYVWAETGLVTFDHLEGWE
jgi:hypothetical protein